MNPSTYYWAYGSNLNKNNMRRRCPSAKMVGPYSVGQAALVFRGVADVTIRRGSVVPGGLWRITPDCERALDGYEGVGSGLYLKRYLPIKIKGIERRVLFYQMSISVGVMPPSEFYLETIVQGYHDFGLDVEILDRAVQESWSEKRVTRRLRQRHVDRGSPTLARATA